MIEATETVGEKIERKLLSIKVTKHANPFKQIMKNKSIELICG